MLQCLRGEEMFTINPTIGGGAVAANKYDFISSATLTNGTVANFTGLSGYIAYIVYIVVKDTQSYTSLSLFCNGDTTATNYYTRYSLNSGSMSLANNGIVATTDGVGSLTIVATYLLNPFGCVHIFSSGCGNNNNSKTELWSHDAKTTHNAADTEITQVNVSSNKTLTGTVYLFGLKMS